MSTNIHTSTENKLAIIESLYRYAAGIDQKDPELISAIFTSDAVSDFRPAAAKAGFEYPVLEGKETIVSALMHSLQSVFTTHSVSNPCVTFDGDKARIDALVEAQHVPKSDASRHYLMKNRYDVELVRLDTKWLIKRITVDNVWRSGDPGVLAGI
ncbi:nuclear transport factor 2 family protein [Rahnella bruchi]|uniref:nuclear transport factor 2 family protein n=1 Tax=Rahnella bruchi TaxID=1510573 RepID=UPI001ABF48A1|nr:nuclear transport factor 2 family protein [Rahnella bruchi]